MRQLQFPREKRSPAFPPGAVPGACVTTRWCPYPAESRAPGSRPPGRHRGMALLRTPQLRFSQTRKMVCAGRKLWRPSSPIPLLWAKTSSTRSSSSWAPSNLTLNVSTDGAPNHYLHCKRNSSLYIIWMYSLLKSLSFFLLQQALLKGVSLSYGPPLYNGRCCMICSDPSLFQAEQPQLFWKLSS